MLTLLPILHPTDFLPRTAGALTYAARLAQEQEAERRLLLLRQALASRPVHETPN